MPPHDPFRIVFVEPAASHTGHLRQLLQFEGMSVTTTGPGAWPPAPELDVDLLVLNHTRLRETAGALDLPTRTSGGRPLTLVLVAPGDELRGVELVERGMDAYLVSPCGPREFVARVRALLRRARRSTDVDGADPVSSAGPTAVRAGALQVDPLRRRVRLSGRDLRLTEQEFQLLYFLAGNPGQVFDRQALLDAVWGRHTFVTLRSVDALVKRLRQQLRVGGKSEPLVETVRGVGYRMSEAVARSVSAA